MRYILLITALTLSTAYAEQVCSVHDGDTFRLCSGASIRVWGIDAPELKQPFGYQAREYASGLLVGKEVDLHCVGKSYKRTVCLVDVRVPGHGSLSLERELVRKGLAYDSAKYSHGAYSTDEALAQKQRLGVWSQPSRLKPWDWRKAQRP